MTLEAQFRNVHFTPLLEEKKKMSPIRALSIFGFLVLIILARSEASTAQAGVCGDPPVVEDIHLKGELDSKAQFLSRLLGDAQFKGKVDVAKNDVLSHYPNADALRINQYFMYVVCVTIMNDNTMPTIDKLNELRKARGDIFSSH
jgi:hypothetical protein